MTDAGHGSGPAGSSMVAVIREVVEGITGPTGWMSVLLTFLLVGVPGTLWKLLDDTGAPDVWRAIVLTAPMTVTVAIIAIRYLVHDPPSIVAVLVTIVVTASITWLLGVGVGSRLGDAFRYLDPPQCVTVSGGGNLLGLVPTRFCAAGTPHSYPTWQVPFRLVVLYWRVFGPRQFLSSIAVGVFLAWMLVRRIPRLLARAHQELPTAPSPG